MLLRTTDPFRDFDRLTQQLLGSTWGTTNRPAVMPMDAWREGDRFVIEFDLPGVSPDSRIGLSDVSLQGRHDLPGRDLARPCVPVARNPFLLSLAHQRIDDGAAALRILERDAELLQRLVDQEVRRD